MTASSTLAAVGRGDGRWTWPLDAGEFDTTIALRGNERRAIAELGSVNLRRLQRQDALAPGWSAVRRLLRPLDAVNAALDSPPTSHRRRAMGDAVAVILLRCADLGRAYWGWTIQEWTEVIGPDQVAFRDRAPGWADDAVRPYLVLHAYLLAGFTEFHRLGSFSRLTLAWRVFGHDRVQDQISRLRAVLAGWGYVRVVAGDRASGLTRAGSRACAARRGRRGQTVAGLRPSPATHLPRSSTAAGR